MSPDVDNELDFSQERCGPMWFKVQICVSKEREVAERLARRLREDGYHAFVVADNED